MYERPEGNIWYPPNEKQLAEAKAIRRTDILENGDHDSLQDELPTIVEDRVHAEEKDDRDEISRLMKLEKEFIERIREVLLK